MGTLGLWLAGSYLGYQFQNLFLDKSGRAGKRKLFNALAAFRVRGELQSLKWPIMKLGQMMSMQSHILPEEAVNELTNLQMRAPAMHSTLARAQFKSSLGRFPEEIFREFTAEPFAAASLGQVHRAVTKGGEQVAVKIQYPAVRSAIESDFKLLRTISLPARLSKFASDAFISELENGIRMETDYINEGKNTDFLREKLKPLPYVEVPLIFWEFTTDRVLTMSYVSGQPMSDFIAAKEPSQELRNDVGARLLALFTFQLRRINAIHADPHPGNYLIDAGGRIGLVDFGCVKKFSLDFIELIRLFEQRAWSRSGDQARRVAELIWGPEILKRPHLARTLLKQATDIYEEVFGGNDGRSIVDFGDANVLKKTVRLWSDSIRNKVVNPEFTFLGRSEMGLYNVLHQLRAKIDTTAVLANLRDPARKGRPSQ
jgi:predicted unusual protein kinase regulating ubiquinone biosynthesis (AarF/ABC1/UbiB family)